MKTITINIETSDGESMTLKKSGPSDEMAVLASSVSTIFLKSKEALNIATKKPSVRIAIAKKKRSR